MRVYTNYQLQKSSTSNTFFRKNEKYELNLNSTYNILKGLFLVGVSEAGYKFPKLIRH